jgi:copper resistance protein B
MKALLALLLAGTAMPALAQETGTSGGAPAATCTPEHAAMGHCTLEPSTEQSAQPADPHASHSMPATQAQPQRQEPTCTPEHAAMGHCTLERPAQPQPKPEQQASCPPEHAAMGHCTPEPEGQKPAGPVDPHAGHAMPAAVEPPVTPPPAEALQGPENAADEVWDRQDMARSREILRAEHGDMPVYKVLVDQLETRVRKGTNGYFLNAEAWYGGDIDKIWFKTEIEGDFGEKPEQAELQALWSRAIDPWFDLQAGIRYDAQPDSGRVHLVLGVQGLAPYWIEIDGAAFLSDKGDITARFEAEHDMRITQRLVLQPRVELDFALQDIPEERVGSGLSVAEVGARLRYHVTQQFSPYVGVEYDRAFGDTRSFRRLAGEDLGGLSFVAGLRLWF